MTIFTDSTAAGYQAVGLRAKTWLKRQMLVLLALVWRLVVSGMVVRFVWVPSALQPADPLSRSFSSHNGSANAASKHGASMNTSSLSQRHALSLGWCLSDTEAAHWGLHAMGQLGGGLCQLDGDHPCSHVQRSYPSWCTTSGHVAARGGTVVAAHTADRRKQWPVAGRMHSSICATCGLGVLRGVPCAG